MTRAPWNVLIPLSAMCLFACTSKRASSSQGGDGDAGAAATATATEDATWSATIDGANVTGRGVDEIQQQNAAFVLPRAEGGNKHLVFSLYSTTSGEDTKANSELTVRTPPHTGTFVHAGSYESCSCDLILGKNAAEGRYARYLADTVTITVTAMSATRVSGTFSGNFKLSSDTPNAPQKRAVVTNGKFDIPMSTSNITPE